MIFTQFKGILAKQGVTEIEAKGKPFDGKSFDAQSMDRLDYLIYCLKKEGNSDMSQYGRTLSKLMLTEISQS